MSFPRRAAIRVSEFVVRHSSAGSREWAEGLEREVAFIESDWRALAWALGSTRVLLEPREEPLGSLDEVPKAAQTLVETLRNGRGNVWVTLLQGLIFLLRYFDAKSALAHLGCGMVVCAAAVVGLRMLIDRRRLKEPYADDIYDELGACTLFYKAELERQRYTLWMPSFFILSYCVGLVLAQRGGMLSGEPLLSVAAVIGCMLALPNFLYARRTNELRIERLDALLAERQ